MEKIKLRKETDLNCCGCPRYYNFTFSIYKNKLMIKFCSSNDICDYGFVDLYDPDVDAVTSYSEYAVRNTVYALTHTKIDNILLKNIARALRS